MTNQTRIDPLEVRLIGGIFAAGAQAVDVACTGLGDCDFGAQLGRRYAHHEVSYSAGLLAMAQAVRLLADTSRQFGAGLVNAASTLDEQDRSNAGELGGREAGRG